MRQYQDLQMRDFKII